MLQEVDYADGQRVPVAAAPAKLSRTPLTLRQGAPSRPGEHTDEVLREFWDRLNSAQERTVKERSSDIQNSWIGILWTVMPGLYRSIEFLYQISHFSIGENGLFMPV